MFKLFLMASLACIGRGDKAIDLEGFFTINVGGTTLDLAVCEYEKTGVFWWAKKTQDFGNILG